MCAPNSVESLTAVCAADRGPTVALPTNLLLPLLLRESHVKSARKKLRAPPLIFCIFVAEREPKFDDILHKNPPSRRVKNRGKSLGKDDFQQQLIDKNLKWNLMHASMGIKIEKNYSCRRDVVFSNLFLHHTHTHT